VIDGWLSTSQTISIGLFVGALLVLLLRQLWLRQRVRKE
jgi:hypothetical protein